MPSKSPFLDVASFTMGEVSPPAFEAAGPSGSPFLTIYEADGVQERFDPQAEEYVVFLNELYSDEFDDAVAGLVDEASVIYETSFGSGRLGFDREDSQTAGYQAERLLNQHFAPLASEAEAMVRTFAREFGQRDVNSLSENEIESLVEGYRPSTQLVPNFENFFGALKKAVKKVAGKAIDLAKKGISVAAKLGLGPILNKLLGLVKPLLARVVKFAIGKLPSQYQPLARKLAERLPFLKEYEEDSEQTPDGAEVGEIAQIQHEFNNQVASLLLARDEVEQELELARALTEQQVPAAYPVAELDRSRDQFVESLAHLREGESATPYVENFVPAILPALKIGIRLAGRPRVVDFLAKFLAKLIQKFIGPQYAPALSKAIVDAGLRLIHLEATPEDESRAAASAVAATVEETVRRVAALPEYILDDQELLEGFALEAFEQAAAANLPPVLSEEVYRGRPELAEGRRLRGTWVTMPLRRRRKCYRKYTRTVPKRLSPQKLAELESFEGVTLQEFLEEEMGVAPGEEVEALVHLYESLPGTRLADIARLEEHTPGLSGPAGHEQLHPLTREAASLLIGEPDLGREVDPGYLADRHSSMEGQRFYYLEIQGKKPLTTPGPGGAATPRRPSQVRLELIFPQSEIRVHLFLGETRSQGIAVKLRQHAHIGAVSARLQAFVRRGLRRALSGRVGRLKIVHGAVTPLQYRQALDRLPSLVPQVFLGHLNEWVLKALSDHFKQRPDEFIKAAEDPSDGVSVLVTLRNPPGFAQLRDALKGKGLTPGGLNMSSGAPEVQIKITPGFQHD